MQSDNVFCVGPPAPPARPTTTARAPRTTLSIKIRITLTASLTHPQSPAPTLRAKLSTSAPKADEREARTGPMTSLTRLPSLTVLIMNRSYRFDISIFRLIYDN